MKHVLCAIGILASLQAVHSQLLNDSSSSKSSTSSIEAISYVGVWAMVEEQGSSFEIVVFPNGQAISTRTNNTSNAHGERGFWRMDDRALVIFFDDGWSDRIVPVEDAFVCRSLPADSDAPKKELPAARVTGDAAAFVGIWRLNKEPDGSYLYVVLQSNGRAFSTIAGGTQGKWESTKEGALCSWPDGWTDLIFATPEGYQKCSWIGAVKLSATPSDTSPATRVGEGKFSITP